MEQDMAAIKAVIWDVGGVLLRTEDETTKTALASRYQLTLKELYRLVFYGESAQQATLGEINERAHWANIAAILHLNEQELADFERDFWAGDSLDMDLIFFIRSLKKEYKTGLLSNAWDGARKALSEIYHCMDAFDYSVFSAEVCLAKPDPAIYMKLIEMMSVLPEEAIFVDDLQENVAAANRLGIHGVQFRTSAQAKQDVQRLLA